MAENGSMSGYTGGESGVRTPSADFDPDFLTLANSLYQKTPSN